MATGSVRAERWVARGGNLPLGGSHHEVGDRDPRFSVFRPGGSGITPAMKHELTLTIAGEARGKARTRPSFMNEGRFIKPHADRVAEADIHYAWKLGGEHRVRDEAAIGIHVEIAVVRPKGHFKRDGSLSAEGQRHPIPRTKKPDVDNALKLVMDALNKRAWRDDVAVASAHVVRKWGEWPETIIRVYTLH